MTSFTEEELAVARIADRTASQQTVLQFAIVAELHLQLFSNILGSDRIVVTSLTFRGHCIVT